MSKRITLRTKSKLACLVCKSALYQVHEVNGNQLGVMIDTSTNLKGYLCIKCQSGYLRGNLYNQSYLKSYQRIL